ncbi:MAG: hypothetical protein NZ529_00460 [Cytophagaceae bacterium]|nr:hypothetical protein [Cytophagaceae bacterium]MDW8455236.1 RHS repeat-associated core domain-containing protein [Cytophagaceae bacterium]
MAVPGRSYNSGEYRFGFNGQERVPELHAAHTTALFWEYDGRLGRWWSVDPLMHEFPQWSTYAALGDNPIKNIDPDGRYFVGINNKPVKFKQRKDGTLKIGRNASADLRYLVNTVNASGSRTAMNQIFEASQNKTKIYVKVESEVHDKPGQLGYGLLGLHQAHDADGNALKWNNIKGDFDGIPAYM